MATTRRAVLGAIAALPLLPTSARADNVPHLSPDDPAARAQAYVEDAARVSRKAHPEFVPGSHCGNCGLYSGEDAGYAPCQLFPGKAVAARGWCKGFAPQM